MSLTMRTVKVKWGRERTSGLSYSKATTRRISGGVTSLDDTYDLCLRLLIVWSPIFRWPRVMYSLTLKNRPPSSVHSTRVERLESNRRSPSKLVHNIFVRAVSLDGGRDNEGEVRVMRVSNQREEVDEQRKKYWKGAQGSSKEVRKPWQNVV